MMRLSPRSRNRLPQPRARFGVRRYAGTWLLLLVGFSVGVAPIHCVLWSCHVAARHTDEGHHDAAPMHAAIAGETMSPTYAAATGDASSDAPPHGHETGSTGSGSDDTICVELDAPGAMTPGSMTTVPAVLGSIAVMPLPRLRGHLAPVEQNVLDEARPPDLQPPRA